MNIYFKYSPFHGVRNLDTVQTCDMHIQDQGFISIT
jgi:hypothetical protein